MNERVRQEIELARQKYPGLQYGDNLDWVLIPDYPLPKGRYNRDQTKLLFLIPTGYPMTGIDNFLVEANLRLVDGSMPPAYNESGYPTGNNLPVEGSWGWFSWHPNIWRPVATIEGGDSILTFLRAVNMCLRGEDI